MPRPDAIRVALVNLGAGEVVLDIPASGLFTPEAVINAPPTPRAQNLRLLDGLARTRPGYAEIDTGDTNTDLVNGAFYVIFDDGVTHPVRATQDAIERLAGGSWTDITGAAAFTGADDDYWAMAMVYRTGAVSPKNQLFLSNGVDAMYKWTGTGDISVVGGSSPDGARVLIPFLDRCFAMNVEDGSGNRKHARIQHSDNADPGTWTGRSSGLVDLDDDPYAIGKAAVMGGGLVVLKGDGNGGSIYRGTPTGLVTNPVRYDALNPGTGVGILLRNTFLLINPGVASFFSHEGWTLFDGQSPPVPIAPGITRSILRRLTYEALDAAFSWYDPKAHELFLAIPVGGATTPNEYWCYNIRERRVYGPYAYADGFTVAGPYVPTSNITWQWEDSPTPLTWSELPYDAWGAIGGVEGTVTTMLGTSAGAVMNYKGDLANDDNGTPVSMAYETGAVLAKGRRLPNGRMLGPADLLTLHDVIVEYQDELAWTPQIAISTDNGTSWTTISPGTEIGTADGSAKQHTYSTTITARQFQARVQGASAAPLVGIYMEFTHAGDERASS